MTFALTVMGIAVLIAAAYAVTFVLTALAAWLVDVLARFANVPWRHAATLPRPDDVHHSSVRFVLAIATLFFAVLSAPRVTENLAPIALMSERLSYLALLIALAEWLEARSARLAAWICFAGMAKYAFLLGERMVDGAVIRGVLDALLCIGFFVLAQRAANDDDRARRAHAADRRVTTSP